MISRYFTVPPRGGGALGSGAGHEQYGAGVRLLDILVV
jgi:hypothetical protein